MMPTVRNSTINNLLDVNDQCKISRRQKNNCSKKIKVESMKKKNGKINEDQMNQKTKHQKFVNYKNKDSSSSNGSIVSSINLPVDKSLTLQSNWKFSQTHQKRFHRRFPQIDETEQLIEWFSCAFIGDILLQGYLYISENYFAFFSNIFGYKTHVLINIADVKIITKEKTAKIFPNAVGICTKNNTKYVFASLLSRENTFKLLNEVWNFNQNKKSLKKNDLEDVKTNVEDSQEKYNSSYSVKTEESTASEQTFLDKYEDNFEDDFAKSNSLKRYKDSNILHKKESSLINNKKTRYQFNNLFNIQQNLIYSNTLKVKELFCYHFKTSTKNFCLFVAIILLILVLFVFMFFLSYRINQAHLLISSLSIDSGNQEQLNEIHEFLKAINENE